MIANMGKDTELTTNLEGFDVYLVDETHKLEKVEADAGKLTIGENQVMLLKSR
jgi:hypothetical protein